MKKINLSLIIITLFISTLVSANEYHVSKKGNDTSDGSVKNPFLTINHAAKKAYAGDTITVHSGTYREWVNPMHGGESNDKRILYRAAPDEKVEIKGSEIITGWKPEKNGVWKVVISNIFFGNYNPYKDSINGDWFNNMGRIHHTGEVFLNGKSLFEKENPDKVFNPVPMENIADKEGSLYTWYCESNDINTTIWANFQKFNPNEELTEISTRKTCIYPEKPGINYITISGFYISQAATQWAAPTAEQVGMISTHWNKGWIIENNVISNSKCNGITLGKERGTGHNVWSSDEANVNRDGNIHYIEVVFNVLRNNWDKEHIGSHIVRNNTIFNCEQTAICGSMGSVFSTIENNHIYNIYTKRQFIGFEIGGIKFHAPVDVIIRKNRIHDCGRGLWLDWMTQGTRVSCNLFYNNDMEDIFTEVNHGPFIIDNNILLSATALRNWSQGGAFLHNLIAGSVDIWVDPNRFTPYFLPHKIAIAGLTTFMGGDDRYFNNIFIGRGEKIADKNKAELGGYENAVLPVWIEGNIYCNKAKPSEKDKDFITSPTYNPRVSITEEGDNIFLHFTPDELWKDHKVKMITTELLGKVIIPKTSFENPDGTILKIDTDYFGNIRLKENIMAGPFKDLDPGISVLKVW